ncbi:MAG: glycosyltransferase family 4 protein [Acidimicrobiales bacterium]
MKVTMLVSGFPSSQGGAERQIEFLAPLLAQRGIELSIVARAHPDSRAAFEHAAVHHVAVGGGRVVAAIGFAAGAVRCIRDIRPDIIHAHGLLSPATAAVLAGRSLRTPVVAKVLLGGENGEVGRLLAWRRGGPIRMRALRATIDRFVVISREIDEELRDVGVPAGRRVLIPNGVDTSRFHPSSGEVRRTSRERLGFGKGPIVLFVGRLHPQKGVAVLLEVWAGVRRSCPTAKLVIVGDGGLRAAFEESAPEGVDFVGKVHDVLPYLASADVFVLPSMAEGLSNALLEAMACGLAVVATDVGATAYVLGDAGRIVDPGDAMALERELIDLLADSDLRARLGARARERVGEGYKLADTADRLVALYDSVLDAH